MKNPNWFARTAKAAILALSAAVTGAAWAEEINVINVPELTVTTLDPADDSLDWRGQLTPVNVALHYELSADVLAAHQEEFAAIAEWNVDWVLTSSEELTLVNPRKSMPSGMTREEDASPLEGGFIAGKITENAEWVYVPLGDSPFTLEANTGYRVLGQISPGGIIGAMSLEARGFVENKGFGCSLYLTTAYRMAHPNVVITLQPYLYHPSNSSVRYSLGEAKRFTFGLPDAPKAVVTKNAAYNKEVNLVPVNDILSGGYQYGTVTPNVAYTFEAKDTSEEASSGAYSNWKCDYIVSMDADTDAYSIGLFGQYGWGAVAFPSPVDAKAGQKIPLLMSVTKNGWNYSDIVSMVRSFTCGAINFSEENIGKTITVSLVMWNENNSVYNSYENAYVVEEIKYKFETVTPLFASVSQGAPAVPVVYRKNTADEYGFSVDKDGYPVVDENNALVIKSFNVGEPHFAMVADNAIAKTSDSSYSTADEAVATVEDNKEITVNVSTSIGSEAAPAGSTVTTTTGTAVTAGTDSAAETTVTPKTVTITSGTGSEQTGKTVVAYVVSQGSGEDKKFSVVTDVSKDETIVSAGKTVVSDFVKPAEIIAKVVASENLEADKVSSMVLSLAKTEAESSEPGLDTALVTAIGAADKAFEIHPVATITTTTEEGTTATTSYAVANSELAEDASFTFTLDFGAENAGKFVSLTHYANDGTVKKHNGKDSWTETLDANGIATVTLTEFSYLLGTVSEEPPATYVAQIGDDKYETLAAALADVGENTPLTWVDDSAWSSVTPVYYNGTFYATLTEAINAANTANASTAALIYVKPNYSANTGFSAAHDNIKTSITIYGNNASLNLRWEPTIEYPGEGYHVLTKDVTFAMYNLHDGAGAWSARTSEFTSTVIMCNCTNAHEVLANGSTTSTGNNIWNIKNCTFDKAGYASAPTVGSMYPVTLTMEGCTFTGLNSNYTVNMNNKCGGTTSATITDCTFDNCGTSSKGAIRFNGEDADATVSGTLSNLTFLNSNNICDIQIGHATSASDNNAEVTYSVSGTTGVLKVFEKGSTTLKNDGETAIVAANTYSGNNKPAVAQIGDDKYETLAAAILAAQNGGTIEILDGTWGADAVGTMTTSESLSVRAKSLTIQAADGATPKFTNTILSLGYDDSSTTRNAAITGRGLAFENTMLLIGNYPQVTVEECSFVGSNGNSSSAGALAIIESCASNYNRDEFILDQVTVRNCTFDGTNSGQPALRLRNSGNVLITGNTIANSKHNGILFESNGTVNTQVTKTVVVQNNTINEWNSTDEVEGGRGIRASLGTMAPGSTVTISDNTFRKDPAGLDTPDFAKITGVGSATVDLSGNDWNDMLLSEVKGNSAIYTSDGTTTLASVVTTRKEPVAQIGTTKYETLAAAVEAVEDGETIQLLCDSNVATEYGKSIGDSDYSEVPGANRLIIDCGKTFTLDLGGHTLSGRINFTHGNMTVRNGTVRASSQALNIFGTKDYAYAEREYSVITIAADATVEANYGLCVFAGDPGSTYYPIGFGEVFNIYGKVLANSPVFVSGNIGMDTYSKNTGTLADVEALKESTGKKVSELMALYGPKINIYDGAELVATPSSSASDNSQGISLSGCAIVNVFGGTVSGAEGIGVKGGVLNVSGGTITGTGAKCDPVVAVNSGTEASGAAISASTHYNQNYSIAINVTGGTITSVNNAALLVAHSVLGGTPEKVVNGISVDIAGGEFAGGAGQNAVIVETALEGEEGLYPANFISGGVFSSAVASEYCADGYEPAENTDADTKAAYPYTVGLLPVAQIVETGAKYFTLATAVAAAEAGDTVELLADIDLGTEGLVIDSDKNFTLDIGEFNITGNVNGKLITNNGTLVVDGMTGCVYNQDISAQGHDAILNNGTITINGGWFGDSDNDKTNANPYNRGTALRNYGVAVINGGHFTVVDNNWPITAYAYVINTYSGTLTVNNADVYGKGNGSFGLIGGTATIVTGTFSVDGEYSHYAIYNSGCNATVLGGTFTKVESSASQYLIYASGNGTTAISGGTFAAPKTDFISVAGDTASVSISGGVFTAPVAAQYCASGYEPAENTDDATKVVYPYTVGKQLAVVDAATGKAEMSKDMSGYKFKMAVSQNGGVAAVSEVSEPVIPSGSLPASGEYATYAFTAVKTADGSETAVQNTVGILRVDDAVASTNTVIAVPWQAFGDKIAIGSLVYLGNRSAGDQLMAYDAAKGTYYSWTLEEEENAETKALVWAVDTTVKTGSKEAVEAPAASEFEVVRGQGVFLKRKDPSKPIYLVGRAPASGETVAVTTTLAAGSASKPAWSLVAAPSKTPLDLNASGSPFRSADPSDTIMLVSAGGVAMKIPYTYKDGKWGRPVSRTVTETRANGKTVTYTYTERSTEGCTIPAGTGFWYLNKGGVKTVEW